MYDVILEKFGDHGAESSRRDRFQEHYAAKWCIQMLSDFNIIEVICEYGEDVVINQQNGYELHQVKTKQESVGDWQLKDLVPIIGKTLSLIPYFEEVNRCCFVSNEGASGILYDLKTTLNQSQDDWSEKETHIFQGFCQHHGRKILDEIKRVDPESNASIDDVKRWLLRYEILTDFHHMEYLEDTNLRNLRKYLEIDQQSPVTYTDSESLEIYDSLINLVGKATIGRTRDEKTITREQVIDCIKQPKRRQLLYRFPTKDAIEHAPGRTRLEKKLNLGGFTQPFVEKSREEMVSVMIKAREWNFGQATEVLEDIRFRVRHFCVDCYDKACDSNSEQETLGRIIYEELKKELPRLVDHYHGVNFPFIDEIFLLGIAMVLTSECKVYWSRQR